jgi:arabinosyltransferase C
VLDAAKEVSSRAADDTAPSANPPAHRGAARLRRFATILGLLGTIAAILVPFLPVNQDVTTLKWPTAQGTRAVTAALESFSPVSLDVSVPCATARGLQARTNGPADLVSTNPPTSPWGQLTGMVLQVNNGQLALFDRNARLGTAALPSGDCTISAHSDGFRTTATVDGRQFASVQGDQRPQLTGIYSALDNKIDDVRGVSVQAHVDTRYESSPSALKIAAIVVALAAFACCVLTLRKLDVRAGRRPPRLAPRGWWKPTPRDAAVSATLLIWWLIGATTSDDGFIMNIARARESAGYIGNYYRWFSAPEAPFGWSYEILALMVRISTEAPWLRLPALLMGIISWLLLSREVLPRLGQKVRRSHAASWAGAAVFLAFWLPYDNGLRPEPVVVLFSLLAYCAVERAVATRRLMPAALGLVGAALAMAANPHGMVAVLPYAVALKPLVRMVRQRSREFGWLPVLAPISACGFVILTLVYSNQTWRSIVDATKFRAQIGPSEQWYQEINRYIQLFSMTPDGSLARRFPVLLVVLCVVTCMMVLLRRGRIRGAALGPSRRVIGISALSFVVLALVPTKWPHHFGIFAAFGGALAALTALATSSAVLRSKRNRSGFFAGLMVVCAFSATGPYAFWYVSGWGLPWADKPPSIDTHKASTVFLIAAGIAGVVALVEHLRLDEHNPRLSPTRMEKSSRALRLGTAPLSIVCALLIIGELATFGKAIQKQANSYSLGADNIKQLVSHSCGLSDDVYVEANPLAGMLPVSASQPSVAPGGETPSGYLRPVISGAFQRVGQPGAAPPAAGKPPNGFGTDQAPIWGDTTGVGQLRTQWYDLPQRAISGQVPIVLTVAGSSSGDNTLMAEYGRDTDHGFEVLSRQPVPPGANAPQWWDARLSVPPEAQGAQKMRIVATANPAGPDDGLAVSAPRAPQLTSLTQFVGNARTFVEWPAAFAHPCLQLPGIAHGIADVPKFRISGSGEVRNIGQGWSAPDAGGPYGWMDMTSSMRELPTYLKGQPQRDWGVLDELTPYDPDALPAQAAMESHTESHWGTWSPGPVGKTVKLPSTLPNTLPNTKS